MQLTLEGPRRPKNVRLDDLDERILWELTKEARITNNELAERVQVSPSTSLARVRALRKAGVLRSAHIEVDLPSVGLHVQAIVAVRLRAQARGEVGEYARRAIKLANVVNIFFMGGADDFLIHVACTSTDQLRDFVASELSMDPAVASTQTNIVFDHLKGVEHMDHLAGWEESRAEIG